MCVGLRPIGEIVAEMVRELTAPGAGEGALPGAEALPAGEAGRAHATPPEGTGAAMGKGKEAEAEAPASLREASTGGGQRDPQPANMPGSARRASHPGDGIS